MFGKTDWKIILKSMNRPHDFMRLFIAFLLLMDFAVAIGTDTAKAVNLTVYDGVALTEQQVVELALKYSRKIQSLSTNVAIANYRLNASGWLRNPELRISDVSTRYYTQEFDELRAGLRFRLPKPGELGRAKQQARVELWDRRVEEIRYQQEFIARIRNEYADVLMYDQLAELAQKRIAREEERIRIVQQLVALGNRTVVYFTKAKVWHADSKNDHARALQNQRLARRKLAKRAHLAEDTPLVMEALPEVTLDLEELIKLAINNRPEIERVQQRIVLANRQRKFEYFKLIPWPNFIDISYHIEKERHRDWGEFMTGIDLPIFNWNIGNIKATTLAVKKKEDELAAIKESIEEEVRSAYIVYRDLLLDWQTFQSSAKELIADAATVVDQAQQHTTLMPDEVLEMELTIIDTQKLLAEKRCNLAHALVDLYYTIGIEGHEKMIQSMNY